MDAEQRQARRYAVKVAGEVQVEGRVLVAAAENISTGGVGLVLDRPLAEGTRVSVMLFLTQDGIEDPDEEPFETIATVRWVTEKPRGRYVAGVRFEGVDASRGAVLERFVAALAE